MTTACSHTQAGRLASDPTQLWITCDRSYLTIESGQWHHLIVENIVHPPPPPPAAIVQLEALPDRGLQPHPAVEHSQWPIQWWNPACSSIWTWSIAWSTLMWSPACGPAWIESSQWHYLDMGHSLRPLTRSDWRAQPAALPNHRVQLVVLPCQEAQHASLSKHR